MRPSTAPSKQLSPSLIWMLLGLLLVCLIPHNQSLWIDESTTAAYAQSESLRAFVDKMLNEVNSDSQFPLGLLYFWVGSRVLGHSEIALRTLSAIWIAAAVVILWRVGLLTRTPYLPALFACNAFAWYYGGEARPYAIQIGLGSGLLYALLLLLDPRENPKRGLNTLVLFGPLLTATCMLAVVPVIVVASICVVALWARAWKPAMRDWAKIVLAGGLTTVVGSYYGWTLAAGKGAQTVGKWGVGIKNLVLSFYELLGFVGFGPGRYELRELGLTGGLAGVVQGFVSPLSVGIVVLSVLYIGIARNLLRGKSAGSLVDGRSTLLAAISITGAVVIMFALALSADFPFWGRHLASILPFVVFVVAMGARPNGARPAYYRALPLLLGITLLASSLIVRFHPDHSRDDYRSASQITLAAVREGKTVWWAASSFPAVYYNVTFCESIGDYRPPCVLYVGNEMASNLRELPKPDLIVLSKPDLHDSHAAVQEYVSLSDYEMTHKVPAFRMFEPRTP